MRPERCDYDTDCEVAEICDSATHRCTAGLDCTESTALCGFCDLAVAEGGQDCGFGLYEAFCDPNAGVCRRIHTSCQPCRSDRECTPDTSAYDNHCVAYDDGRFCAVDCGHGQACPRGFSCQDGACLLESILGQCSDAAACSAESACPIGDYCTTRDFPGRDGVCLATCLSDADCQRPQICRTEPGPRFGTCIDGCDPPGSGSDVSVCHETGHMGPRCATHADCLGIVQLEGFECFDATGPCDGRSCSGWCAQGGCDDSSECPLARTYCDTASRECRDGCGADGDCGAFELCDLPTHTCHKQPCRGKDLSCDLEQWCCGKELYDDSGAPEHLPCPTGVEFGTCFDMQDPYCRPCEDNDDCADIDQFGYDSSCFELKTEDADGNEVSLGKYCSVGCESNADCPRGIECIDELPTASGGTAKGCLDARCVP